MLKFTEHKNHMTMLLITVSDHGGQFMKAGEDLKILESFPNNRLEGKHIATFRSAG